MDTFSELQEAAFGANPGSIGPEIGHGQPGGHMDKAGHHISMGNPLTSDPNLSMLGTCFVQNVPQLLNNTS